jgi:hypothetical protein
MERQGDGMADQAAVNDSITKWIEGLEHIRTGVTRDDFVKAFLSAMPEIASKAIEEHIEQAFVMRNFTHFRSSIVGALAIAYQCGVAAHRNGRNVNLLGEENPS